MTGPAMARPGFYAGVGVGGTAVSGNDVTVAGVGGLTTEIQGGFGANVRLGYNILGYAAIETMATGHGASLGNSDNRVWSAQWHIAARAYPLWHWRHKLPEAIQLLEPSLLLGWGIGFQGYKPRVNPATGAPMPAGSPGSVPAPDSVGWKRTGVWLVGAGLEYPLSKYVNAGIDYHWLLSDYDTFIFNFDDGIDFPVSGSDARTQFHQFFAMITFQMPAEEPDFDASNWPADAPDEQPLLDDELDVPTEVEPEAEADEFEVPAEDPAAPTAEEEVDI